VVFVAIAGVVVTYNCRDGSMAFKPLKAASETVTTLAINKDGTMLASGASDRTTVVFIINVENPNSLIEPILRFQLGDSITAMDFSPLTLHLFVASANDFATYMPNKTGISKERSS
jgi:WD40 repeat protein